LDAGQASGSSPAGAAGPPLGEGTAGGPRRGILRQGTDIPHGIWGEIARQVDKFETFKDYYSPLKAPGRTAWITS